MNKPEIVGGMPHKRHKDVTLCKKARGGELPFLFHIDRKRVYAAEYAKAKPPVIGIRNAEAPKATYGIKVETVDEFNLKSNKAMSVDTRVLASHQASVVSDFASINARSLTTRPASAALAACGRDAGIRQTSRALTEGRDSFNIKTVADDNSSDNKVTSATTKGPVTHQGPAAQDIQDHREVGNGSMGTHQVDGVAVGAQLFLRFEWCMPDDTAKAVYEELLGVVAMPDGAEKAIFEGLLDATVGRKAAYKNLGQGDNVEGPGLVVTQEDNNQIPGQEAPKRQRASGQQATQETCETAYHPNWGGGMCNWSWDNNSQGPGSVLRWQGGGDHRPPRPGKITWLLSIGPLRPARIPTGWPTTRPTGVAGCKVGPPTARTRRSRPPRQGKRKRQWAGGRPSGMLKTPP